MTLRVEPSGASCGALIYGPDLSEAHSHAEIDLIRDAWLKHQVIGICGQELQIGDLERFAVALGPDGDDPFIASIAGHPRVVEVRREANETTPVFAEAWHSDWSFLEFSPAGTLLYGKVIPPIGGDTLFANQYAAYDALTDAMKAKIANLQGIHSWHERCGSDRAAVGTLRTPKPSKIHLPTSLVTRTFDSVGQSLRIAYRDGRLSRPSALAMANYHWRAACGAPYVSARCFVTSLEGEPRCDFNS